MKSIVLFISILSATYSIAQTEGTIVYEETIKFEINFEDSDDIGGMDVKSMLPSSQSSTNQLLFSSKASLYISIDDENEEPEGIKQISNDGGTEINIFFTKPEINIYRDIASGNVIEAKELMTKKFLIEGSKKMNWKLTGDQKEILGHACSKAIAKDSTSSITAWFTTQIPVAIGPATYGGLPGAILYLNKDNGKNVYEAKSVTLSSVPTDNIKKPKGGKKVTREEFLAIAEAKMKELHESMGHGRDGEQIIMIKN